MENAYFKKVKCNNNDNGTVTWCTVSIGYGKSGREENRGAQ